MIKKKKLIFLGAPGSGKGTLSSILTDDTELVHISTGDILRNEIKNKTELGKKAKEFVSSGGLVPDEIVTGMVESRLKKNDCDNGFILDGFPRTEKQAELLDEALKNIKRKLDAVILFKAEEELLLKRLTARIICRNCGQAFNKIFSPPEKEGVCDKCSGELYQRPDDSFETAKDRLEVFKKQTYPLIKYYEEAGLLLSINAGQKKEKSYPELLEVLN